MITYRFKAAMLAWLALVALAAVPVSAKDKWIALTTKNLNLVSNADENATREVALKIEQFHFILTQLMGVSTEGFLPVTVIVFKNDSSFKPYKPLYNGKPGNLAGYFQPGPDENLIALELDGGGEHPLSIIFHEYTHLLNSYTPREWPLWLKEGLAELYSTFDVKKRDVTLGAVISNHVYLLRESKFMPLADLFNVRHNSPAYNERDKQNIFYAESWALMHYLMYGDHQARKPQLIEFIKLMSAGVSADRAFTQVFKTDLATMEKDLRRYVGNNTYPAITYTMKNAEGEKDVSVRVLADAETQFYLGNLLMRTNRLDEAETVFKQALALDADLARPYEGLGFVEMRRNHFDQALEYFKQAATRDSKNYLVHYYYAEALQREAQGQMSAALAAKIVGELKTAIGLRPQFAPSYYLLGFMTLVTGENLKEGAAAIKTAMRLEPQNKHHALTLAQIQIRMQDYAAAKKTLEPLLAGDDTDGLRQSAQSVMQMIEFNTRPAVPAPAASPEPRSSQVTETPAQPGKSYQLIGRPTIQIAGAQIIRGLINAIDCSSGKYVLVVKMPDKLIRFAVTDQAKFEVYSQDPSFDGSVGCGAVNRPAFIYFKPLSAESTRFAGDAVAIEFTK